MKRFSHIILGVWLSMLVIWLGGGIGLLCCEHSGEVEIVQMAMGNNRCGMGSSKHGNMSSKDGSQAMQDGSHTMHNGSQAAQDCCKKKPSTKPMPCMHLKVLKLQPATVASHAISLMAPVTALAAQHFSIRLPRPIVLRTPACTSMAKVLHGPPRLWLSIIRVLII